MGLINKYRNSSIKAKIIYKNIVGAFIIRGGGLVVSLFTLPVYLRFFADQQILGVWFTVLSILSWILNFDMGIGNGLRNNLTKSIALNEKEITKEYISSAYWMLGFVVFVFFILGSILFHFINWNTVFNVSTITIPSKDMEDVVQYTFLGIMLQFFLRLISAVLYAIQKSAINNLVALLSKVFELFIIILIPSTTPIQNIRILSLVHIFTINIPLLITTLIVFFGPLKSSRPNLRFFKKDKAREVLSLGGIFFLCQILFMLIANTNEFFIAQYTQPNNVVSYQIYNRLFTLGSMIFMVILTPIWSAVSKAVAEKDYIWLQKLHRNLSKLAILSILFEFFLILIVQEIINFWLKENAIQVDYFYALIFALFGSVMIYQSTVSVFANGTGRMKIQAISYAVGIFAKVIIIHVGITLTNEWIVVVLANMLILIPYCVIQEIDLRKFLRISASTSFSISK